MKSSVILRKLQSSELKKSLKEAQKFCDVLMFDHRKFGVIEQKSNSGRVKQKFKQIVKFKLIQNTFGISQVYTSCSLTTLTTQYKICLGFPNLT